MLQKKRSLKDLQNAAEFIARHIGPSAEDQQQMLRTLGCNSLQQLTEQVVPEAIAMAEDLAIVDGCSEAQALEELRALAESEQGVPQLYWSGLLQHYYAQCYSAQYP